jgi:hypothetical protein
MWKNRPASVADVSDQCDRCSRPVPPDTNPEVVKWEFGGKYGLDGSARCPDCVRGDPYHWGDDDDPLPHGYWCIVGCRTQGWTRGRRPARPAR